jgi:hypothetical protein
LRIEVGIRSVERRRRVTLRCRDGIAVLDDGWAEHVTVCRGDGSEDSEPLGERIDLSEELPLLRELTAFVMHLGGGPPPRSNAADGAAIVTALAALRNLAGLPD